MVLNKVSTLFGAGVLAALLPVAGAQMPTQSTPSTTPVQPGAASTTDPTATSAMDQSQTGQGSVADRDFLKEALQGGMAEVQLGQLAVQKSSNDQVKQFGQKMVDDHTKLGNDLLPIAQRMGITPPTELSKKHQRLQARLQSLSGSDFDHAYVAAMLKDHKHDKAAFGMEMGQTSDPQLKDAVSKGTSVITMHLQMIEQIAKEQGVTEKDTKAAK